LRNIFFILLFLSSGAFAQNGLIKSYYGPKKIRAKISYANGILDGTSTEYYENGNLKSEKTYDKGKLNGWVKEYYENGLEKEEYQVKDGARDGITRIFWDNGALKEIRTYQMGKLIKRVTIDYDPFFVPTADDYKGIVRKKQTSKKEEVSICDVEICPEPIGGQKAIQERVVYPAEAKLYELEGTVSVLATIDENGFVKAAQIIKGLGLGCDEAAINAVKKTSFLPGQKDGKPVTSHLTIKVEFKLGEEKTLAERTVPKRLQKNENVQEKLALTKIELEDSLDNYVLGDKEIKEEIIAPEEIAVEPQPQPEYLENIELENKASEEREDKRKIETTTEAFVSVDTTKKVIVQPEIKYKNLECAVDVCPEPKGGMAAIMEHFKIPRKAYQLKLSGDIVVSADIDKYGNVRNTHVVQGLGYGCDEAAEVAILDTRFKPGIQNGERVRTSVIIIIPVRTMDN